MKKIKPILYVIFLAFVLGMIDFVVYALIVKAPLQNKEISFALFFLATGFSRILIGNIALRRIKKENYDKNALSIKGFFTSLKIGTIGFVISFINLFMVLRMIFVKNLAIDVNFSWMILISLTLYCFSIGYFEEILFRGYLFNALRKCFSEDERFLSKAMLLAAFIFAIGHVKVILLSLADLKYSISMFIFAGGFGAYFTWVYLRSKSLSVPIAIHAFFDWSSFLLTAFFFQSIELGEISGVAGNRVEFTLEDYLFKIGVGTFFFLVSFFRIRNMEEKMLEEVQENPLNEFGEDDKVLAYESFDEDQ